MDLWMLSRVAAAVASCNKAFETYDFPVATSACYNLWLYDLCDVYLVSCCSSVLIFILHLNSSC